MEGFPLNTALALCFSLLIGIHNIHHALANEDTKEDTKQDTKEDTKEHTEDTKQDTKEHTKEHTEDTKQDTKEDTKEHTKEDAKEHTKEGDSEAHQNDTGSTEGGSEDGAAEHQESVDSICGYDPYGKDEASKESPCEPDAKPSHPIGNLGTAIGKCSTHGSMWRKICQNADAVNAHYNKITSSIDPQAKEKALAVQASSSIHEECMESQDGTMSAKCMTCTVRLNPNKFGVILTCYECQRGAADRTCHHVIKHLEWSPDSKYILSAVYKLQRVHVFSMENHEWKCKLSDVEGGIIKAFWSPDSRHLLTVAELHVSVNVWSLITKSGMCIESPSAVANPAYCFSHDGSCFIVIQDDAAVDAVSCYSTSTWKLENKITGVSKERLGGITSSPIDDIFVVWDSLLHRVHCQVFEATTGRLMTRYEFEDSCSKICGVQDICWAPSGQFLALGCLDNKVRILNNITWQLLTEFFHNEIILSTECKVYKEPIITGRPVKENKEYKEYSFEELDRRPVTISSLPSDPKTGRIAMGIGLVAFSSCNCYIATVVNRMPAVVWIWSMEKLSLHSISVLSDVVTMVSWSPVESKLAIATGCSCVSIWSPASVSHYDVPAPTVTKVKWHLSGKSLALCAGTKLALLHLEHDVYANK